MTAASDSNKPYEFFKKQGLMYMPKFNRLKDYVKDDASLMAMNVTQKNSGKTTAKINSICNKKETKTAHPISEGYDTLSDGSQS